MSDYIYRILFGNFFIIFMFLSFPHSWNLAAKAIRTYDKVPSKVFKITQFVIFLNIQIFFMAVFFSVLGFWRTQIELTNTSGNIFALGGLLGLFTMAILPAIEYQLWKKKK